MSLFFELAKRKSDFIFKKKKYLNLVRVDTTGLGALKTSKSYLIDLMVKSQGLPREKIGKVGREE